MRRGASQGREVCSTAQFGTQVIRQGTHVGAFATPENKIQLGRSKAGDFPLHHANKARLPLDVLALAGGLVQGNAIYLDRRKHRRRLVLVAMEAAHCRENLRLRVGRYRASFQHIAFSILGIGDLSQLDRASVFFVEADEVL